MYYKGIGKMSRKSSKFKWSLLSSIITSKMFTNVKANLGYHTNSEHVLWSPLPLEKKCKIAKRFGNKQFCLHNIGTTVQIDWC